MPEQTQDSNRKTLQPSFAGKINTILCEWGKENYQDYPWRNPDQPWHGLIAEILLQRTRANNVVPIYEEFVTRYKFPSEFAEASIEEIGEIIYPLGLSWRASLIRQLGSQLALLDGKIPVEKEKLLELAGVGPYVASAWLSFHGEIKSAIVDVNIVRFICRLLNEPMDGETRRKKWLISIAELMTPEENWKKYNFAVLDFSMRVCKKKPLCNNCPIGSKYCEYRKIHSNENKK